jgi:hypothetical protein
VFNNPVSYVDPTGLSWWDKVKSFGRGLWNGFTGFFHEAIFVPMDFVGTGIDIFLGTGYETRSYLGRAFEEKLRAGQLDDWRDMYESLFLNVVLGGIPDLYVSLEDAYWGNWEPLGEWLGSAGAGTLVWGSCKLLQKRLPSAADRPPGTPVGRKHHPLSKETVKGQNPPQVINGRPYTGHAVDRMQQYGLVPSVIENTIEHGQEFDGRQGRTVRYDPVNNVVVILEPWGEVVTVGYRE